MIKMKHKDCGGEIKDVGCNCPDCQALEHLKCLKCGEFIGDDDKNEIVWGDD